VNVDFLYDFARILGF